MVSPPIVSKVSCVRIPGARGARPRFPGGNSEVTEVSRSYESTRPAPWPANSFMVSVTDRRGAAAGVLGPLHGVGAREGRRARGGKGARRGQDARRSGTPPPTRGPPHGDPQRGPRTGTPHGIRHTGKGIPHKRTRTPHDVAVPR
ncbi:hypothetical protein GBW32_28840 [Streptomyces tsukubensis]|nr:hypothetical protein GBW32_28840 [Streptomyces tsukubensis]